MAAIFLSYVRSDEARAGRLAHLLEESGHQVWWDRHIASGAQFAEAIEDALKSADKVVVLWSADSGRSAWVRDEAAEGRDSGRLIPIVLDGTGPPLGFRQFQALDFSKWRGAGKPAKFADLLAAIDGAAVPSLPHPSRRAKFHVRPVWIAAMLAILLLGTFSFLWLRSDQHAPATVLVEPADRGPLAQSSARDLAVKLGAIDDGNVLGFRLTSEPAARKDASFVLQVGGKDSGETSSRDLILLGGEERGIMWAGHFEQPRATAADLPVQLETAAALVLKCALETAAARPRLRTDIAKLYLTGCARLEDQYDETATKVAPLFEKVVAQAPGFAPAWNKLLYTEALQVDALPDSPVAEPLRKHLAAARAQKIDSSATVIAEAALRPSNDYYHRLQALEGALQRFPHDAWIEASLGDWLMRVGRQNEAVEHARRAMELDPVSPAARMRYLWTLAHSGKPEALSELRKAERLWPAASNIQLARFSYEMRYGNPRAALKMIEQGSMRWGQRETVAFLEARQQPTPANVARAVELQTEIHKQIPQYVSGLVVTLATFGRNAEAIQALLDYQHPEAAGFNSEGWFRSATSGMRRDPRFMQAMARTGLAQYWRRSGKWPDFCSSPGLPYNCRTEAERYL